MSIELRKAHHWIVTELGHRRPIAESMRHLIELCEAECPHPDWRRLRSLPYDDLPLSWILQPFRVDPPQRPLRGLWFGLFNPCPDMRTPTSDIYVCGSERFYAVAGDNGWAVRPEWHPKARDARSLVLADIYAIAYQQETIQVERKHALMNDAEYPLCLGYGAFAVHDLLTRIDPTLILGASESIGVAVGFDEGDFVLLGKLTKDGLEPVELATSAPEPSLQAVLEGLRSTDEDKLLLAMLDLPRLGERAKDAVPDLLRLASAEQFGLRQFALNLLSKVAPDDRSVKAAIIRALDDHDPFVRREALQALIDIKNLTPDDLARIRSMEKDPDGDVARWSEIAMRNIRLRGGATDDAPDGTGE